MKNWIAALMAFVMILTCTACGGGTSTNESEKKAEPHTEKQVDENDQEVEENKDLPLTYSSYFTKVDIDVPNVQVIENRRTKIYVMDKETMATISTAEVEDEDEELVFEAAMDAFQKGMENLIKIESYETSVTERNSINGFDMLRFEGTLKCTSRSGDYELPVYGYTFYSEGYACGVIGFAGSYEVQDPDESSVEYIREIIDDMIATVRPSK